MEMGQAVQEAGRLGGGSSEVDNYARTAPVTELRDGQERGGGRGQGGGRVLCGAQSRVCASGM